MAAVAQAEEAPAEDTAAVAEAEAADHPEEEDKNIKTNGNEKDSYHFHTLTRSCMRACPDSI